MAGTRRPARRVIFVHPHSVIEEDMVQLLVTAGFEVATLNRADRILPVVRAFSSCILFINIEAELPEPEWDARIRRMVASNEGREAGVGIVVYNPADDLAEKYLMDIGVTCGFVTLKLGFQQSARIILKTLEANEARGDRQYVRVAAAPDKASMTVRTPSGLISGEIIDISSAGMACHLNADMSPDTQIDDIQLRLWGSVTMAKGRLAGVRGGEGSRHVSVIIFHDLAADTRRRIFGFVRRSLQAEVDRIAVRGS